MSTTTEFKITRSVDGLYDMFYPFGIRIDWSESKLQYAPDIEIERQSLAGADTDVMFGANYGVRGLTIVGFTADGLTRQQMERLKSEIANTLNVVKTQNTRLLYYDTGYVNVSLSGVSFIDDAHLGYLKATFKFSLVNPFNYQIKSLVGNGTATNEGLYNAKPIITFTGETFEPEITCNGQTIVIGTSTLSSTDKIVIDCEKRKVYKTVDGVTTDITHLIEEGDYFELQKGDNVITSNYPQQLKIEWQEKYLWGTDTTTCETYLNGYEDTDTIYVIDGKIYPFDLYVNYTDSEIPFMPETTLETLKNGNADGASVLETKYKSRIFEFACYSEQGLNVDEKNTLSQKVLNTFHLMKDSIKTLYFVDANAKFKVRINGNLDCKNHAGHLTFTLGFETVKAYSEKYVTYDGISAINNGIIPCGFKVTFSGAMTNPSITVGNTLMSYVGNITLNSSLNIDTERKLCYNMDSGGIKTNAKKNYNGKYPLLEKGSNTITSDFPFTMTWNEKYLWGTISNTLLWEYPTIDGFQLFVTQTYEEKSNRIILNLM